jgi:hypothetical protein
VCSTPRGVTLPEDVARWVANHADNERQQVRKQRSRLRNATRMAVRVRGEETPSEPESLGDDNQEEDEDEEEGEITPLPTLCPLKPSPHLVTSSASSPSETPLDGSWGIVWPTATI